MLTGHGGNIEEVCRVYGVSELLDFSTNVNPLGYPPGLKDLLFKKFDSVKSYPDIKNERIRSKLAHSFKKSLKNIMVGNGSTELLYLIPKALCPSQGIVFSPSYSDYADSLTYASVFVKKIPLLEEKSFIPDLSSLHSFLKDGDMLFLGNPNNPTSNTVDRNNLYDIIISCPKTFFVIDESFNGFLSDWKEKSLLFDPHILEGSFPDNLLVVQSLTKLYAIPGLRLGMVAASEFVIKKLEKFMQPWSVNSFALSAAEFIIDREEYRKTTRNFISKEKKYVYYQINSIKGLKAFFPEANFIFVKIKHPIPIKKLLIEKYHIYVRDCSNFPSLNEQYFRIAILRREENNKLIVALREIFSF